MVVSDQNVIAIKQRVEAAFLVLRQLPETAVTRPMGPKSFWPEMRRSAKRGAILHRCSSIAVPNSQMITDCYRIVDALYELSVFQRQLIWARAAGVPWKILMVRFNRSRAHLYRLHKQALSELALKL